MVAKTILDHILSRMASGGLRVYYPDGTVKHYGPDDPSVELHFKHPRVMRAILLDPLTGLGESYMNGQTDIIGDLGAISGLAAANAAMMQQFARLNLPRPRQANRRRRQRQQIAHHYDLGNDFYKLWLDESMTYSCAYFRQPTDSLEQAQDQKVDYILRKLQLKPGQTLLDIGCGWGKLLIAAVQQYGVTGHGITLSAEQHKLAQERVAAAGLADKITIELRNYQDLPAQAAYDRIVSVGMYEHVGKGNHATYFKALDRLLKPDGLSVLHTITAPRLEPISVWTDRYIFPGGYLPTVAQTAQLMERYGFELQDYENLRFHYALTLEEWQRRFDSHRDEVVRRYDERFYRMWRFYLGTSAGGFRYAGLTLSQFVMTKGPKADLPLTREHLYAAHQ
ncbi:MAG TPA: cyclopropane-fatty-acyl-phospholipid synthase family protein [Candidatus Saccharimonadia bacterium]